MQESDCQKRAVCLMKVEMGAVEHENVGMYVNIENAIDQNESCSAPADGSKRNHVNYK